ncbi:hypothetical protein GGI26_005465 [Coemansia sp. RSA 1358]|uniref:DUF4097 domain-containing protein n=1 Tax=Coemansia umbellata TaxID=1424467 RepID=A0ABQ8PFR3_9FUNG|nr:hypothetical protein EDC05_005383 [Coemansia umbellata]KAJ2619894.1 hypothetical protein GGI26_005465 [Coemansia sp. RSA 1358]
MATSRGQRKIHTGKKTPEEFPPIDEQCTEPPPYTVYEPTQPLATEPVDSIEDIFAPRPTTTQPVTTQPTVTQPVTTQPVTTQSTPTQPAITQEYYHPASFPGYTVIQVANGESQPLLRRTLRRRTRRGCLHRLCSTLCACLCFLTGLLIIFVLFVSILHIARASLPQGTCNNLAVHTNTTFVFGPADPLVVESSEGVGLSRVHLTRGERVAVHVVVETNRGWGSRIAVDGIGGFVAVRADRWVGGCVRATITIEVPHNALLPLHVTTGTGTFTALSLGALSLNDTRVSIHNGNIDVHGLEMPGMLQLSTTNGRITAKEIRAHSVTLESHNGVIFVDHLEADNSTDVKTSNSNIHATHVVSPKVGLVTTNGMVAFGQINGGDVSVATSNARVQGDLAVSGSAVVHNRNGAVDVQLEGTGSHSDVSVRSSNALVKVAARNIKGGFEAWTSNSRVDVLAESGVHYSTRSSVLKRGVYGDDPSAGKISVGSSNAPVVLQFL